MKMVQEWAEEHWAGVAVAVSITMALALSLVLIVGFSALTAR